MEEKNSVENRFDIDIGYITKSPCRDCLTNYRLPECSNACETLTRLQALLVGGISCSNYVPDFEEYFV